MAPSLSRGLPFVYILQLRSGKFYTGCSTDYEVRFKDHKAGTACKTTKEDSPDALLWIEIHSNLPSARQRETQLKKWSRAKKEALTAGRLEELKNLSKSRD